MKIETTSIGTSNPEYVKRVRDGDVWRCYTAAEVPAIKADLAVDPPDYLTMIAKAGTLAELKTALVEYLKSR